MVVEGDTGAVGMGLTPTDGDIRLTLKAKQKGEFILLTHADDSTEKLHGLYNDGFGNGTVGVYDNADTAKIWLNTAGDSYFIGGDLGIGTTSPNNQFHVYTTSDITPAKIENAGGGSTGNGLEINCNSASTGRYPLRVISAGS